MSWPKLPPLLAKAAAYRANAAKAERAGRVGQAVELRALA